MGFFSSSSSLAVSLVLVALLGTGCRFGAEVRPAGSGASGAGGPAGVPGSGGGPLAGSGGLAGSSGGSAAGGTFGSGGTGGAGGSAGGAAGSGLSAHLTDFPATPVVDPAVPPGAADMFDGMPPRASGSPCITSPIAGTLMPRNWLRPRFDLQGATGDNVFEVKLSVPGFAHSLRIVSASPTVALDRALWDALRVSVVGVPITVTARSLAFAGGALTQAPSPASTTTFTVAPVDAPGKIVYWALADDMGTKVGSLKGFGIGEEGVQDVLVPSQVPGRASGETCVGCHAATPDGNGVGFTMGPNGYTGDLADIRAGLAGTMPTYVAPAAKTMVRSLHGIPAFSPAHWSDGDRIMLLSDTGPLHWVELGGGVTGTLARTGDNRSSTEPTFSHDGQNIVYVSGASLVDGRLDNGPADLYVVPFANRAGGAATPLPGASDANATEYYPSFSPDDRLVAFTRVAGSGSSYSNAAAEVYVVPFGGGQGGAAVRLAANDAATCQAGRASPGLTNDWPKWSPRAASAPDGRTYYWLTFSSKRTGSANAQLYVTAIVREPGGELTTYPALYLWNQPAADGNHTPSWDDFALPPIVIGFGVR